MKLLGLQKLTLLDYPEHMACTVFTGGCNFRCPFCHNRDLVFLPEGLGEISPEEFFAFLKKRKGILEGVCVTGGEPLLHPEIKDFIKDIKALGYLVKLDTNGSYPQRLKELVGEGLIDYVAMDIKNSKERYAETAGVERLPLEPICESVEFLLSGAADYEFRTTVVKDFHEETDFISIREWIKGAKRYYLQGFRDSGALIKEGLEGYEKAELERFKAVLEEVLPRVELRGV